MRTALILTLLLAPLLSAEDLLPMDEPLPYDDLLSEGSVGLSTGCTAAGGRLRGEWSSMGLHLLGDVRPGPEGGRGSGVLRLGSLRAEFGSTVAAEGLLGLERRRSGLASMPSSGASREGLSLGGIARGAEVAWEGSILSISLGWDERRGSHLGLERGPWHLDLHPGHKPGSGALALRRFAAGSGATCEIEMGAAGPEFARRGFRMEAAGGFGPLEWGMESLLLDGPRPDLWRDLGWIGAAGGREGRIVSAWKGGPCRLRGALRWREGIGLADRRVRREILLSAALDRSGIWQLELRRREDRDWTVESEGPAFPVWSPLDSSRWETRLSWERRVRWMAVLRSGSGDEPSLLLRLEPGERKLPGGLDLQVRMDMYRTPESDSFRFVRGDALSRRHRSLRGRGYALSMTLRWRRGDYSARFDADAGTKLSPSAGFSLHWRARI